MSRWYMPLHTRRLAELDAERIAGLVLSATHDATLGAEFFSVTDFGRKHGVVYNALAPTPGRRQPDLSPEMMQNGMRK